MNIFFTEIARKPKIVQKWSLCWIRNSFPFFRTIRANLTWAKRIVCIGLKCKPENYYLWVIYRHNPPKFGFSDMWYSLMLQSEVCSAKYEAYPQNEFSLQLLPLQCCGRYDAHACWVCCSFWKARTSFTDNRTAYLCVSNIFFAILHASFAWMFTYSRW